MSQYEYEYEVDEQSVLDEAVKRFFDGEGENPVATLLEEGYLE